MIYTMTLNPALDYVVDVDKFTVGQVNRTTQEMIFYGGKGINVSYILKQLDVESTALGYVAGFTGQQLEQGVQNLGIQSDFIHVEQGLTRINVKLRSDQETEINGRGPDISQDDIQALYFQLGLLKKGDILVLSGSIPPTLPATIYQDILQYLQDKDVMCVVDATKDLLANVLPYHPFLIKPNHHELAEMFQVELKTKDDIIYYARQLKTMGACNVLVSMAGDGALLVDENDRVYHMGVPQGQVKNSVGAGDSMVAGFLAGYIKYHDYQKALLLAIACGSASAYHDALATYQDIEQLLKDMIL